MIIPSKRRSRPAFGIRGAAIVEYAVATSMTLAAVLLPFGSDDRSVLKRLVVAIQQEHAGYLYAASVPALPRGNVPGGSFPPGATGAPDGHNDSSSTSPPTGGAVDGASSPTSPTDNGDGASGSIGAGGEGSTGTASGDSPEPAGDDAAHLVDADANGETGNGEGSCPAPDFDDESDPMAALASLSQPTQIASTQVGNPIQVVTGNKYQRAIDLQLPALHLAFVRHYNSRSSRRGALGVGWTHGFDLRLLDRADRATLWQADGRRIDFLPTVDGQMPGVRRFAARQYDDGQLIADRGGYEWRWLDGTVVSFDRDRRLRQVRDASGHSLRLTRDGRGRIAQIRNEDDRALELGYDAAGRLETLTGPEGVAARYAYDAEDNLARVESVDHSIRRYHYEDPLDPHNLTGISVGSDDAALERVKTWAYDDEDRGILFRPADAARGLRLTYEPGKTRVTDAQGRASVYFTEVRDGTPLVSGISGQGCSPCDQARGRDGDRSYAYNDKMQLLAVDSAQGPHRRYAYDGLARLTRVEQDDGRDGPPTWLRISYWRDTGQVESVSRPSVKPGGEHSIALRYRDDGQISQRLETGFAPQPDGRFVPIERRQRFEYAHGRLLAMGGFGRDTDSATRLLRSTDGATSTFAFPDGGTLSMLQRDERGRPLSLQADEQPPLDLHYGPGGRLESVSSAAHGQLSFDYGSSGQLLSIRKPDLPGAVLRFGHATTPRPDRASREPGRTQPRADLLAPALDILSVTDPRGGTTRYHFDDFGRRVFTQSPDSGVTRYEYDEDNKLRHIENAANERADFNYDVAGRITEAQQADGVTRFAWTSRKPGSRISTVERSNDASDIRYDAAGRVERLERRIGLRSLITQYRYGDRGQLISKALPDGRKLEYRYREEDGSGTSQLSGIFEKRWPHDIALLTGIERDPQNGGARTWRSGDGIATARLRERGQLARLRIGTLHDFGYRRDRNGRIVGIDDAGRIVSRYRYDARGRLDFALTPTVLFGYRYDANGNRVGQVENGQHTLYFYAEAGNRLLESRTASGRWFPPLLSNTQAAFDGLFSTLLPVRMRSRIHAPLTMDAPVVVAHRPAGEIEALGQFRFTYNANGQIEEVWRGATRVARYRYDAQNLRTDKQLFDSSGRQIAERIYAYEDGMLSAEADAEGRIQAQYLYVDRFPVAVLTPQARYFVHTDHLGAPIAVTDKKGEVIWRATYGPFGRAQVDNDADRDGTPFELNLRLPGQYEDAETGLHYNHHRYYDPDLGRYLSPDPLGLSAGLNPYVYAANDPINNVDPCGLLLFAFDGTGNNDPGLMKRDISNIVKFRDAYLGDQDELGVRSEDGNESDQHYFYISGPATIDARTGITGSVREDSLTGATMIDRIAALADDFFDHIAWLKINQRKDFELNVDTIGFSRGAAEARIFVNLLTAFLNGDDHFVLDHTSGRSYDFSFGDPDFARKYMQGSCVRVNLRFMGLFDTVPHYSANELFEDIMGTSQDDDLRQLDLAVDPAGVPNSIQFVAHAVAANENRKDFHVISIHPHPLKGNTEARMEMGFIGAHADIGGGYSEGDLSDVTLMWMVRRASKAGIAISSDDHGKLSQQGWDEVSSPVLHDSSDAHIFFLDGRLFKYTNGIDQVTQHRWYDNFQSSNVYGMDYELSMDGFFGEEYRSGPPGTNGLTDHEGNDTLVGIVKSLLYRQWLFDNYGLAMPIDESDLGSNRRPPPTRQ